MREEPLLVAVAAAAVVGESCSAHPGQAGTDSPSDPLSPLSPAAMQQMLSETYKNKLLQMTSESRRQDLVSQACSRCRGGLGLLVLVLNPFLSAV